MKVLELFAGTRSIGKAFEEAGHEVFSVDWDRHFDGIDLYTDIGTLEASTILELFGQPDVIWASPDCTSFSVAAISRHRVKNKETGNLDPVSDYAKFCDLVDQHMIQLIKELSPKFFFIENPRGGAEEDDFYAGHSKIYGNVLQIRRHKDETDRHLDKSSRPEIHTAMQERRPVSHKSAKRGQDRNSGIKERSRKGSYTSSSMQAYRRDM